MLPQKFSLCSTVILRSEPQYYDSYTAFNYKTVQTKALTEAESKALAHIYEKPADLEEIAVESGMKQKDCEKFLKKMTKLGYIQLNADTQMVKPPRKIKVNPEHYKRFSIPFLSAPASIDFFITSRCNLSCAHCFANRSQQEKTDLPLKDIDSVLNQLEQMGVLEVRITGGEPLLHREITKILQLLGEKRVRKVLLTNGTLLSEEIVLVLKASGITPTVSLDDSEAEEHDHFRGVKGSHERTLEGLKLLQKHGVQYGINCCLNQKNIDRYQNIINLAAKYGASRIALLDLKPIGQMSNNPTWVPSDKDYQAIFKRLLVARAKNRKIEVSLDAFLHCYPMQESILLAKKGVVSCKAGISRLSIGSDGSIYPCNFVISDNRWNMGNIKNEPLADIWFSDKWRFFRGQTKLNTLSKCKDCKSLKYCNDFYCRLLPYTVYGDELSPPPKCNIDR
jgi:radical SAM protein with 4Fe4S-binding SPASM domain